MNLEELLKKDELSIDEINRLLSLINAERKDDDKRIELFNHALYEAKKFDIQFLHGIYKNIEGYDLPEEEKRLLQNTVTFYMSEKEDMSEIDVQQMLAFIVTERKDDTEKAKLYNRVLFEASKHGAEMLNKVKSTIISASLSGEEDAFVNGEQKNHTNYGSASKHI